MLGKLFIILAVIQLGTELYLARYRRRNVRHGWNDYAVTDAHPTRVTWAERSSYLSRHRKEQFA